MLFRSADSRSAVASAHRTKPSIAVLPFVNLTTDPAYEFFCDGLTDELINTLSRAPGLRVHGLAWAPDGTLWVADTSAGTVSRMDVETGMIWEVVRVEAPTEVHGLTIRDGVLWYCDAATRAIGQLHLD